MGFEDWFKFMSVPDMLDWGRTCGRMQGVTYEHRRVLPLNRVRGALYDDVQQVVFRRLLHAVDNAVHPWTVSIP